MTNRQLVARYKRGDSLNDIARAAGMPQPAVRNTLIRLGVKLRTPVEGQQMRAERLGVRR